ncbi:peptide deformylase [Candidatus Vidania fulgoroideorum]
MLIIYPNKILKKKSSYLRKNDSFNNFINEANDILKLNTNIGISGVQLGFKKRIFAIKYKKKILFFINPEIIWKSNESNFYSEGCISIPDFYTKKNRSNFIKIKAFNLLFKKKIFFAKNLYSACIQHEIDHLNGKLINDGLIAQFGRASV